MCNCSLQTNSAHTHLLQSMWRFWRPKACVRERHSRTVLWTPSIGCKHRSNTSIYGLIYDTLRNLRYRSCMTTKGFQRNKVSLMTPSNRRRTRIKQHKDLFLVFSAAMADAHHSMLADITKLQTFHLVQVWLRDREVEAVKWIIYHLI